MDMEIKSKELKEFIEEIKYKNRNPHDNIEVLKFLDDKTSNPELILTPGTKLYRSRVMNKKVTDNKDKNFKGYDENNSFVPPREMTQDLRANYKYIPYLYCANDIYTAIVEVRPNLGAKISVATIFVKQEICLLDFALHHIPESMSENKKTVFKDLSMLYSKPITRDDDTLDYIPTQYIAEYAKYLGYDGIVFKSSLTPEFTDWKMPSLIFKDRYNAVIFNYDKCKAISSDVYKLKYSYVDVEATEDSEGELSVESVLEEALSNI